MPERLLLIHNPEATDAKRVDHEVIRPLEDAGFGFEIVTTPSPEPEDNIETIAKEVRDGDLIVPLGGDGTHMQTVNAAFMSERSDLKIGPLAYGGFIDLANRKARIMDMVDDEAPIEQRYPLMIKVNDALWRYSPGYTTLGFTATAAASFSQPESRARLKRTPRAARRLAQVAQLGSEYFAHHNEFLPAFHTGDSNSVRKAVTDVLFPNNNRVGGLIRGIDFGATAAFGVVEQNVSRPNFDNIRFGLLALVGRAPSTVRREHTIHFIDESTVPIHTEGEFAELKGVHTVSVTKDPDTWYQKVTPAKRR